MNGEIIVYSDLNKIKIGDGKTNINDLEFASAEAVGRLTAENGVVFGDIENNQAGELAIAVGSETKATGKASFAVGVGSEAQAEASFSGGTTNESHIKDIAGIDIGSISDSLITEALGERGIRLKNNLNSNPASIASGVSSISYGTGTRTHTALSASLGVGAESGSKGFYLHKITVPADGGNITISLSTQQKPYYKYSLLGSTIERNKTATWNDSVAKQALASWSAGDKISIILKKPYFLCESIVSVNSENGIITVTNTGGITKQNVEDATVFDSLVTAEGSMLKLVPYQFSIAVPAKPEIGTTELHFAGIATGLGSIAAGTLSQAHGLMNLAAGQYSFVVGKQNEAGYGSFACGEGTKALGNNAHAEGYLTIASGNNSHAEGHSTVASSYRAHAEGYMSRATAVQSHAEGHNTEASGNVSHAEGYESVASGRYSHAEGQNTEASSESSHAEGTKTKASGQYSHAEGFNTKASGNISHAEGSTTVASGYTSHSEGFGTTASGHHSHAEGYYTTASGDYSHAEGSGTIASGECAHVQGKFNIKDEENKYAHIVGNGTSDTARSNAHTLDWDGNAEYAGDVLSKGKELASEEYVYSLMPTSSEEGIVIENKFASRSYLSDIESDINPSQAGTGDPSPDNVRPILSHSQVKLQCSCGKNLYDKDTYPLTEGKYINSSGNIDTAAAFACTFDYIPISHVQGKKITLNHNPNNSACRIAFYKENKSLISTTYESTVSVPSNAEYIRFTVRITDLAKKEVQLEVGSTSTSYEPYKSETLVTFNLGRDVYGGHLDWSSGVLTVDRECYTFTGNEVYGSGGISNGKSRYWLSESSNPFMSKMKYSADSTVKNAKLACSKLPTIIAGDTYKGIDGIGLSTSSTQKLFIYCDQYANDLAGFKEMMKGAQLVYELRTPIKIQLASVKEVKLLAEAKTIYCDTGYMKATGRVSCEDIINKIISAIIALGGNI